MSEICESLLSDADDASVAAKDARNGEPLYYHRTASRTRVDIIRI
jgi:hypothetical protein